MLSAEIYILVFRRHPGNEWGESSHVKSAKISSTYPSTFIESVSLYDERGKC